MRFLPCILTARLMFAGASWATEPKADFVLDSAITAGAGLGSAGLWFAQPELSRTSCPCEESEVNAFDRLAVGLDWHGGEPAANAVAVMGLAVPLVAFAIVDENRRTFASDALLVAESASIAGLLTQGAKIVSSRPYPFMYSAEAGDAADGKNYASFWSGHAAVTMAAAVTAARLFERRRPHSGWRRVVWIAGPLLAVGAGLLQMTDGNQFPTDVAVGAGVGAVVGVVNPWLHEL